MRGGVGSRLSLRLSVSEVGGVRSEVGGVMSKVGGGRSKVGGARSGSGSPLAVGSWVTAESVASVTGGGSAATAAGGGAEVGGGARGLGAGPPLPSTNRHCRTLVSLPPVESR